MLTRNRGDGWNSEDGWSLEDEWSPEDGRNSVDSWTPEDGWGSSLKGQTGPAVRERDNEENRSLNSRFPCKSPPTEGLNVGGAAAFTFSSCTEGERAANQFTQCLRGAAAVEFQTKVFF